MFVRFKDIKSERLIDVRTRREFIETNLFPINIPIINGEQYAKIKRFYPCALFVIGANLVKDRKRIKLRLLEESNSGAFPIVLACSRGRLRSPLMCIYAKMLGIDARVLWGGVKGEYERRGVKYDNRYRYR